MYRCTVPACTKGIGSCQHKIRVGQNHIYTVYIRYFWYFWQGNHQKYGHIRCIYTVLANPTQDGCVVCEHKMS